MLICLAWVVLEAGWLLFFKSLIMGRKLCKELFHHFIKRHHQKQRSGSQYDLIRKISPMYGGSGHTFPKHSTAKGFWQVAFYLKRKGVIWSNEIKIHFLMGKLALRFQVVKRVMVQINQHFGLLNAAIEHQVGMWEIVTLRFFFALKFEG